MIKLLIDQGNTRLKWQLREAGNVLDSGENLISDVLSECNKKDISSVVVSCVQGELKEKQITQWLSEHGLPESYFVKSSVNYAGVTNGYEVPEQLGVDRWLAMLAAFNKYKDNVCVVDSGTAVTVDFVLNNGQHLGGYIVPGLDLQINSLRQNTQKIKLSGLETKNSLGKNTDQAVVSGVQRMLGAFITQTMTSVEQEQMRSFKLIITGGAIKPLQTHLEQPYVIEEDLVFDGLDLIKTAL